MGAGPFSFHPFSLIPSKREGPCQTLAKSLAGAPARTRFERHPYALRVRPNKRSVKPSSAPDRSLTRCSLDVHSTPLAHPRKCGLMRCRAARPLRRSAASECGRPRRSRGPPPRAGVACEGALQVYFPGAFSPSLPRPGERGRAERGAVRLAQPDELHAETLRNPSSFDQSKDALSSPKSWMLKRRR